uniref:Uncharacterized protein n=1 Tax=Rhizophora mucronata TaxID=61149 RepID=A0A2P2QA67_RHIMU
MKVEFHNSQTP